MALSDRLRQARGSTTQKVLAQKAGVSQGMISQIEKGRRPHPSDDILRKLERGLGRPHGYLSAPDAHDASFERYLASDYARDDKPTEREIERLREIPWKPATDDASPRAWSLLLQAIRSQWRD